MPPDVRTLGIGAAVIVAVIAVGAILWGLLRPLRDAGKETGDAITGAVATVGDAVDVVRDSVGAVGNVVGVAVSTTGAVATGAGKVAENAFLATERFVENFDAVRDTLTLRVVKKRDQNLATVKRNWVTVKVTNSQGHPVPGARVQGIWRYFGQRYQPKPFASTGPDGIAELFYEARAFPGTHAEDDVDLVAQHSQYNSSNTVVVR